MTNNDIFNLVNFIIRKDKKGNPDIVNNFNRLLQQANSNHFKEEFNIYQANQNVNDTLSPFEVRQAVSGLTTTSTTITLPTSYAHFIGMYWTDSNNYDRAFDLVTDDQWDMRLGSTLSVPSNNYPICKIVNNKLYISPSIEFTPTETKYGSLYNWYAASNSNMFPTDWGLPTLAEFQTLETYLGGASVAGGKMKETGLTYWKTPNGGATNSSSMSLRGAGIRSASTGAFSLLTEYIELWGESQSTSNAHIMEVYYFDATTLLGNHSKKAGFSIRPIYKGTGSPGSYLADYDGNIYEVVQVGTQYWLKQNWRSTSFNNGTVITKITDNATWAAATSTDYYYCNYNNDDSNV